MKFSATVAQVLTAVLLMALAGSATAQQIYPSKPIRFIIPLATGGGTTTVPRLVGQKLTENWGQQVIIDNRPGGNSIIGTEVVAKAAPDGYTLLSVNSSHVVTPLLFRTPYDGIKDFAPVATFASTESVLVVHPSVPVNTLQEFVSLAKSRPGELNFGSSGTGGASHMNTEAFSMLADVKMQHIPYKGGALAMADLIGGQVQLFFTTSVVAIPHIKSGKLKAIAITGQTRFAGLPQVPTFAEAGMPEFKAKIWYGILAPAATPKAIIDKLSAEFGRILTAPDMKAKLASQGLDPYISTPDEFAALIKADTERYSKVIKAANIKLE